MPIEILDNTAKSLGDKIDLGEIMLSVSSDDQEALKPTIARLGIEMPNLKIAIYKNRRGQYKDILLWCNANRGICRIDPIFITNYNYEIINIEDLKINVISSEEESPF